MSSTTSNYDTPSPARTNQSEQSQSEREIADSQPPQTQQPDVKREEPVPVRRPSFEKLDATEVAKALQIADLLKTAKSQARPQAQPAPPQSQPQKQPKSASPPGPKKPSPPPAPPAEFIPRPPPIPFSGTTNPDAVALRATADLLQTQKARATENIARLEQLKLLNRKDPKEFLKQLMKGNLKAGEGEREGVLGPTVGPEVEKLLAALEVGEREKSGSGKDGVIETNDAEAGAEKDASGEAMTTKIEGKAAEEEAEYPRFPTPQNIVRTPAINWAKYGILGETIDNMHDEQRTNPTLGEPERLASRNSQPATPVVETDQVLERGPPPKATKFVMAAPYDPLKDQLKKAARKPT